MYVAVDGSGWEATALFASDNEGKTWYDPHGRTGGRHTSIVMLDNGDLLGFGGKGKGIDGYMVKSYSRDKGKSWELSKSIFPAIGGGHRPSLIKLASGRLCFTSDFRDDNEQTGEYLPYFPRGYLPGGGGHAGLSEDNGVTWFVRKC